ncbi:DUF4340 domain-containing protein [Chromatocurvus halotolerans]|uniref:Uncharacterized protein DUF4340 n=1 Tax=Chromatocurvus halotolerans TaxID=1132028 RepID=A0A4R2L825_9GAMM|nr:DUF4340 domain-containing protein [Chromatocurvus halotolerans]TCO75395.1 uncharacterized protein DUF4340 [Chromatocurvus halotolerans]
MTARLVALLALAACLQLSAVVFLHWPGSTRESDSLGSDTHLLPLAREDVTRITVADANGREISVLRQNGQWHIDNASLPAAKGVVDRLLDALTRSTGFPVARSDSARARFEVDDAHFQRRITLASGAVDLQMSGERQTMDAVTIYLGTSPGIRQVYARRGDSTAIQAITLSTFDVPATVDGWLEPRLLSLERIDRVRYGNSEWTKSDSSWISKDAAQPPGEQALEALQALEQSFRTLQVTGTAATIRADGAAETVTHQVTIRHDNRDLTLRLSSGSTAGENYIHRSDFDRWFALSRYDHDRLADALRILSAEIDAEKTTAETTRAIELPD